MLDPPSFEDDVGDGEEVGDAEAVAGVRPFAVGAFPIPAGFPPGFNVFSTATVV